MHRKLVASLALTLALTLALIVLVPSMALATTVKPAGGVVFTATTVPGNFIGTTTCDSQAWFGDGGYAIGPDGALLGGLNNYLQFAPGPLHTFTYSGVHRFGSFDGSVLYLGVENPSARCASATKATFSARWTSGYSQTVDPVSGDQVCQDIVATAGRVSGTVDFAARSATTNVSGSYKLVGTAYPCP